ncbi:MAG: glutamate 5-kinase, partial [Acidobacteria bacterium]|nr:glutamate 5-kinase [Acidobacteriota bacterium]
MSARRIVVKAGTNVVMQDDGGLALSRLYGLIESVARLRHAGREVLVVSSGAVGLGTMRLGLPARPKTLAAKQAAAAVGQGRLMALYADAFEKLGLVAAQVLLTEEDFTTRERYLNLSATLEELFRLGVVPILNENDTVSTVELKPQEGRSPAFGDNDRLSALVASKTNADLLVLLTDVDGLFTESPRKSSAARLVPLVPKLTPELLDGAEGTGARGRGGMRSKLLAAEIATKGGALAVIANGRTNGVLDRLFAGEELGTLFLPRPGMSSKKRW